MPIATWVRQAPEFSLGLIVRGSMTVAAAIRIRSPAKAPEMLLTLLR